jgi:hypothetical protein
MTIRVNRWAPDSCTCIIEYSWDDSVPQNSIVLTPTTTINRCPAHTTFVTPATHYSVLMEENPRKNLAHQNLLDNGPATLFDVNSDGVKVLKKGINLNWVWSGTAPNRIVTVTISGLTLTTAQKNTAQSALNTKFGAGKVVMG